jgi:hypothetical protein
VPGTGAVIIQFGSGVVIATEHELDSTVTVGTNTNAQRRPGQHGCRQKNHQSKDGYSALPNGHFRTNYPELEMQS